MRYSLTLCRRNLAASREAIDNGDMWTATLCLLKVVRELILVEREMMRRCI